MASPAVGYKTLEAKCLRCGEPLCRRDAPVWSMATLEIVKVEVQYNCTMCAAHHVRTDDGFRLL